MALLDMVSGWQYDTQVERWKILGRIYIWRRNSICLEIINELNWKYKEFIKIWLPNWRARVRPIFENITPIVANSLNMLFK